MSLHISPSGLGDESGRISNLERALGAIQREANGMSRERIKDANGQVWEALARREAIEPIVPSIPFRLSVSNKKAGAEWEVSAVFSTVTDGTNGDMFDLSNVEFDKKKDITTTQLIMLKAFVNEDLSVQSWELVATLDEREVVMVDSKQTEALLLIGKVFFDKGSAIAIQCIFTAQRLTHGLLNGVAVRVFDSAPVHADYEPPKN